MRRFRKMKKLDENDEEPKFYEIRYTQWEKNAITKGRRMLEKAAELGIPISKVDGVD